jgi:surface protein
MCNNCKGATTINCSGWIYDSGVTTKLTTANGVFQNCTGVVNLNVTGWDVSQVTSLNYCFYTCSSLVSLDLSDWVVSKCTNFNYMFSGCSKMKVLDISNFSTLSNSTMTGMLNMTNLEYLIIGSNTFKFAMRVANCGGLNTSCKILVPRALLDTYKSATNWSARASQFAAIEEYTITRSNGRVTVTPNS